MKQLSTKTSKPTAAFALMALLLGSFLLVPANRALAGEKPQWVLKEIKITPANGTAKWKGYNNVDNASTVSQTSITHSWTNEVVMGRSRFDRNSSQGGKGLVKKIYETSFTFNFESPPEMLNPGDKLTLSAKGEGRMSGDIPSYVTEFGDNVEYYVYEKKSGNLFLPKEGHFAVQGSSPGPITGSKSLTITVPEIRSGQLIVGVKLSARDADLASERPGIQWIYGAGKGTEPEPEKNKHSPVIFLPGVAGTVLYTQEGNYPLQLWPVPEGKVERMLLDESGVPMDKNVLPGDIIRTVGTNAYYEIVYKNLIEEIERIEFADGTSYKENENLFVWGYDWRMDNAEQLLKLDKYVNHVRAKTDSKKVILIAHSMGGLISRAYAVKNPDKVETIITIGSPFAGSPKPFYALVMGYTFGNPLVSKDFMKGFLQNAPATYQLLPQYDFVIDSKNFKEIPNQELYDKIRYKNVPSDKDPVVSNKWSMNKNLLQRAKPFYRIAGTSFNPVPLPAGIDHYAIIGIGVQTLEGFVLRPAVPKDKYCLDYAGKKVVLDPFFGNGDGTVPLKSANIKNTTRTYFIKHENGACLSSSHGELPSNKVVQMIIKYILKGVPNRITGSPDPDKLTDTEPKTDFTLRSDAHLTIQDKATGKILGYNDKGQIEETLPGTFLVMEAYEHVSVAGIGKPLSVQVKGIRDGKFSLEIKNEREGHSTSFSFDEVGVQNGTVATFQIDPEKVTESSLPKITANKGGKSIIIQPSLQVPIAESNPTIALEEGYDRPGGEYIAHHTGVSNAQVCFELCSRNPNCVAFTWVKPNLQGPTGVCWLKSSLSKKVSNSCCVSGVVKAVREDYCEWRQTGTTYSCFCQNSITKNWYKTNAGACP